MRHLSFSETGPGYYRNRGSEWATSVEMRLDVDYPTGLCEEQSVQVMLLEASGLGEPEWPCETAICVPLDTAIELAKAILRCAADDYSDLPPDLRPTEEDENP